MAIHIKIPMTIQPPVKIGLASLIENPPRWLEDKRLGLLCNQASILFDGHKFYHAADVIKEVFSNKLRCLFTPQHGLFAEKQDNMVESADGVWNELSVFSLYGTHRQPTTSQLEELDILLVDLQDVGTRVYTFIWTLFLAMEACARHNKAVAILDRPNPIGGDAVEGNLLQSKFRSFVGMDTIPMRHGMTIGELAGMFQAKYFSNLELFIIPMQGWRRYMAFEDTGLPWVMPSPNMPCIETAFVYPGQVLLEATNLSEGRGTTRPFELFGAPYLRCTNVAMHVEKWRLPGFFLREQHFEPTFHKWAGQPCHGFQIHVTDRRSFKPYSTSLALVSLIIQLHRQDFQWKSPPYEYEFEKLPADLIIGNQELRKALEAGADSTELHGLWQKEEEHFKEARRPFLLY
ncbi:MAG: DUF1343 domain-containing protein [Dissulfuribacterales bacterium]